MKMASLFATIIAILFIVPPFLVAERAFAENLGVMGQTYPIIEVDFLQFIKSRLLQMQQNGQWQTLQRHMQNEAESYRDRPTKVMGLTKTIDTKSWQFDPSITLDHDVITPDGRIIALSGTRVNPLLHIHLSKTLIFFDADDKAQVQWALDYDKKIAGQDKLILVNGSLLAQEKLFAKPIYFDQAGVLTTRFGIHHVPAIVTQDGLTLKVSEVKL